LIWNNEFWITADVPLQKRNEDVEEHKLDAKAGK
jgi:hypothetical protein